MGGIDVVKNHIIVVVLITPVGVLIIKCTVVATAHAANRRLNSAVTLRSNQFPHCKVCLQVLEALDL